MLNINKIFSCSGKRSQKMYRPYSRYPNSNGYQPAQQYAQEYTQEYQDYAPVPHQVQGPPVHPQNPSNPFVAAPGPSTTHRAPPKRLKKKKRAQASPAVPAVPQPGTIAALVMPANPAADQPTSSQPGLEWVLVAKNSATPEPSKPTESPIVEPEPVKINAGLAQAQEELDKVQWIAEAAMICLVEPRREFPIEKFGIIDAFVPAQRIEVLSAATTLASIIISCLKFFKVYGLPDRRDNRLLGKTKWNLMNEEGVASGFTDMSHLSPEAQNRRLETYNTKIRNVVRGFLLQFSGHQTFYRRSEMVVKQGSPTTILQKHLLRHGHPFRGYFYGYSIHSALEAMSDKEILEVAELAITFYDEVKGPLETRTMVMKAIGLHPKDLRAAAAYLETAADPIPYPSDQDLEDWTGWNPQIMDILNDLQKESLENHIRTEKMSVMMSAILRMMVKLTKAGDVQPPEVNVSAGTVVPLPEPEPPKESPRVEAEDISNHKE